MGQRTKQTFIQRRHTDSEQTHEKMLNITHYQRNANQNTMRYHFTPVRMAAIQKSTSKMLERVWRKGNPLTLLVGLQTSTATMVNSVEIP